MLNLSLCNSILIEGFQKEIKQLVVITITSNLRNVSSMQIYKELNHLAFRKFCVCGLVVNTFSQLLKICRLLMHTKVFLNISHGNNYNLINMEINKCTCTGPQKYIYIPTHGYHVQIIPCIL